MRVSRVKVHTTIYISYQTYGRIIYLKVKVKSFKIKYLRNNFFSAIVSCFLAHEEKHKLCQTYPTFKHKKIKLQLINLGYILT